MSFGAATLARPNTPGSITSSRLAEMAVDALVGEATLTPKPGLVDSRGSSAHTDMDIALMIRSAEALRSTFQELAEVAAGQELNAVLRTRLAAVGRSGEERMFAVTRGVNTHRGAIWALGLSVAAVSTCSEPPASPADVLEQVAHLARQPDMASPPAPALRNGQRARSRYGVGGAIGNAQDGFPAAASACQAIAEARANGADRDRAMITGLLTSMAVLDDTCLLHRGGVEALRFVRDGAARVLAFGLDAPTGRQALFEFDARLNEMGWSPGGSADMLAVAMFIDDLTPTLR
jgi:triphosphoribosyl-dephospho-CoA synthase